MPVISFRNAWQASFYITKSKPGGPFQYYKIKIMFYVYYIRSKSFPDKTYIGFSSNLKQRLSEHNLGKSVYTKQYRPWELIGFLGFDQEAKALKFERYLKSNAGRIFLRRYFNNE